MAIILFDGECNLCSACMNFIARHDVEQYFQFASLRSEIGQAVLRHAGLAGESCHSLLLFEEDGAFDRSAAVVRIARHIKRTKLFAALMSLTPQKMLDAMYSFVAARRHLFDTKPARPSASNRHDRSAQALLDGPPRQIHWI